MQYTRYLMYLRKIGPESSLQGSVTQRRHAGPRRFHASHGKGKKKRRKKTSVTAINLCTPLRTRRAGKQASEARPIAKLRLARIGAYLKGQSAASAQHSTKDLPRRWFHRGAFLRFAAFPLRRPVYRGTMVHFSTFFPSLNAGNSCSKGESRFFVLI